MSKSIKDVEATVMRMAGNIAANEKTIILNSRQLLTDDDIARTRELADKFGWKKGGE